MKRLFNYHQNKKSGENILLASLAIVLSPFVYSLEAFIKEIHYDNTGGMLDF